MYLFYFFSVLLVSDRSFLAKCVHCHWLTQLFIRPTLLLVPLMFCYLFTPICGKTFSSNCSLLVEPGPALCAADRLYEVLDF